MVVVAADIFVLRDFILPPLRKFVIFKVSFVSADSWLFQIATGVACKTLVATLLDKKHILKNRLIIFLVLLSINFSLDAQTSADSTNRTQTTTEKTHGPQTLPDNRYGPFHWTIHDSTQRTVTKFGHYISVGVGSGQDYGIGGASALFSYSLAYKSLIFSVTRAGSGGGGHGGSDNSIYYRANYFGFLIGESVRFKHGLVSLSTGIATSNITVRYRDLNSQSANTYIFYSQEGIISVPIELKLFLLARNGIGFGLHVSHNIISPDKFSSTFFGVTIVFGGWNKSRGTK